MMKRVGIIGLGDMGSGIAKNAIGAGFPVHGFDLDSDRMRAFEDMGGAPASSPRELGERVDAVFIMVMNGAQVRSVIFGEQGLIHTLSPGATIILTATIMASEAKQIAGDLADSKLKLIDSPVSGGFAGAQSGTLTMMAAAEPDVLKENTEVMQAISKTIHHVGTEVGMGQTVKACLQSLIGSIFSASFEAACLAAKAGVSGQVLFDVVSTSGAGCGVANTALENIIDRRFEKTGSHINTMYKDLTIALDMARELDVPLFTASTAMQLFQAGKSQHPDGDNWVVTRVIEDIVDAKLTR